MTETNYQSGPWDLSDLYPENEPARVEGAFNEIREQVDQFETRVRPLLQDDLSPESFLQIINQLEALNRLAYRLYGFSSLSFSANTQDQSAQTRMARVQQFLAEMQNKTLFFSLWWKQLDDANAERLMSVSGDYHYWLEEMRHFKKYTLSEPEEKIINIKDVTGANAIHRLYDSITNRYTFKLKIQGEEKELTRGELMVYVRQADPEMRAAAYQELYRVYRQDAPILGQIYQTLVRDWRNENIHLRGFASPISVRNLMNDIPDEVVDILLSTSQKNAGLYQRYFQLKSRWMGMERIRRYDIYAPVATTSEKQYEFGQGAAMVLEAFHAFSPEIAVLAERVLAQNHLDSEVRKGKRGGAFCYSVDPRLTPWVLLNYQGRADDVATMAHELGHAIHAILASDHSLFTFHSNLPLAETASTFAEMNLVDRLLHQETDEEVRRDILFRQVDDTYATIMRQSFFAQYERKAHDLVYQGASVNDLAQAYLENLHEQFGDSVEFSDEFRWEWVSIPHMYQTPFYVYAYSFGQLLVLSLYQQYKQEGQSFVPRYRNILATGGSQAPVKILSDAGINVHDPAFWQGGFDVIRGLIEQLEQIPVKR